MLRPVRGMVSAFGPIPLLLIPMALYSVFALTGDMGATSTIISLPMISGDVVQLSAGDVLLCVAGALLIFEIAKAADTSSRALVDMALSIVLCVVSWLALFILPGYGTATWVVLVWMQTADAIGCTLVSVQAARRDWGVGGAPQ